MRTREGKCLKTKKISDTVQCDPPRDKGAKSESLGIQGLIQMHNRHRLMLF